MKKLRTLARLAGTALLGLSPLGVSTGTALAVGGTAAATVFVTQAISPEGGLVSGFGIAATFKPGSVATAA